ncbi:MAG TPA: hypothetical protein VMT68_08025 [Caulobacteraceae bacterium]|nr:hypothetical protein [Caulobacteraceae bacterium]
MLRAALAAVILAAPLTQASARPGDVDHPFVLKMRRGTDTITVRGELRQNVDCCAYAFKAHAGQKLYWTERGATARIGLTYPDGDGVNPGLPSPADLPQDGRYIFIVSPNLMADGAFGPFTVTLRIPRRR